jgi:hypothetical protein
MTTTIATSLCAGQERLPSLPVVLPETFPPPACLYCAATRATVGGFRLPSPRPPTLPLHPVESSNTVPTAA